MTAPQIPTFTLPDASGTTPYSSRPAFVNPYTDHRSLSKGEQELLGEYARLAATIKRINGLSSTLSSSTAHSALLSQLRVLERKMGLVLTLFKASVWAIVVEQQDAFEEAQQQQHQMMMMAAEAQAGYAQDAGQGGQQQWAEGQGEGESMGEETLREGRYY